MSHKSGSRPESVAEKSTVRGANSIARLLLLQGATTTETTNSISNQSTPHQWGYGTMKRSMMSFLCLVNMRAQTFLLLPQGLLLFASDAFAAHDHHYRLVARFLAVRRAARHLLIALAL